jgi:hypothetical protein
MPGRPIRHRTQLRNTPLRQTRWRRTRTSNRGSLSRMSRSRSRGVFITFLETNEELEAVAAARAKCR